MVSKKKLEKEAGGWVAGIEKYSRQIWLAGLGAYAKVSSDGNKLFDSLVEDGEKAEKIARDEVDSVKAGTKSRVGGVKEKALGKWSELEEAFDKRLNSAISRIGVPSRHEVASLHQKVDSLTRQIEKLTGHSMKEVTPAPTVARTAPLKPAPAKKPASKAAASKPAKPVPKPAAKAAPKPVAKAAPKPAAAKPAAPKKPAVKKPASAKPATSASSANSASSPAPAATPPSTPSASA
ncbi:phasin family protein [Pseudomonas sp. NPDC007930]|uniref:phasin family protein n=1 Tax=Pseudomonas sp. NPDC007930 TaxID=3364417 RepID=UPI0036E6DBB6